MIERGSFGGPEPHGLASAQISLVETLKTLKREPEAIAIQAEVVNVYRNRLASDPYYYGEDLADALILLGKLLTASGKPTEALVAYREGAALYKGMLTNRECRSKLPAALVSLSVTLDTLGHHDEATSARQEADLYGRQGED